MDAKKKTPKVDSSTATSLNKPAKDSRISSNNAQNMSKPQATAKVDSSTATNANEPQKDSRILELESGFFEPRKEIRLGGLSTKCGDEIHDSSPKAESLNDNAILQVYSRLPIIFEKGSGVYLYDKAGKEYLDFGAGIAVNALGYGNESFNAALKAQIDKLLHISNLYYNTPAIEAAQKLAKASGLDRVFFTNSGAEACEGALKVAKKYAYQKRHKIPPNHRYAQLFPRAHAWRTISYRQ